MNRKFKVIAELKENNEVKDFEKVIFAKDENEAQKIFTDKMQELYKDNEDIELTITECEDLTENDNKKKKIDINNKLNISESSDIPYIEYEKGDLDCNEDIQAIFKESNIDEKTISKIKSIFETAVLTKVNEISESISNAYSDVLNNAIEEKINELEDQAKNYLEYVVNEWLEENELELEKGITNEINEDFILNLKNVFEEHWVNVPEEKIDVLEKTHEKLEKSENELNEAVDENISLKKQINELKKEQVLSEVSEGLTESQKDKLKKLSRTLEYSEDFKEELEDLKESYFGNDSNKKRRNLDESLFNTTKTKNDEDDIDPEIDQIRNSII